MLTLAAPEPEAGDACSHDWLIVTAQLTGLPAPWVIVISCAVVVAAALAATFSEVGETVIVGVGVLVVAVWVTLTVLPATVITAERFDEPVFAVTLNESVPLPVRPVPFEIVSHDAVSVADHAQPVDVVTVTEPVPAADERVTLVGDTVNEQLDADCVTVKVRPAAMIVPVRVEEAALASAVKATLPLPVPLAPLVIEIQVALVVAAHAQLDEVVTAMVLLPPPDAIVVLLGEML
jgi:hypothetical protein